MSNISKNDLSMLKDIGFDNLIQEFGEIVGSNMGGDEYSEKKARMFMRDFLNDLSLNLDPDNHSNLDDEE